jgi:acyl transferase domain-containing protein
MEDQRDYEDFKVAVVGMACLLPKAPNLFCYWKELVEGNELLSHFSRSEMAKILGKHEKELPENLIGSYGFIQDADCFDHQFFGFTRNEALRLDPQHRVFLQTCWHALEDASCEPSLYPGKIGVFAGSGPSDYYYYLKNNADKVAGASDWELKVDTCPDFLVSRSAYKLGLRGPAVAVQTACSTSLVAIHLGIQSLLAGESDMVLAGGVTLSVVPKFDIYDSGGITARDGHCRPFDEKATGTVGSSGCGVVALKLMQEAIKDGDHIYGVVLGSSINNDGNAKMSFSSPSIIGQREVIERAIQAANIDPNSVGFIEAHGTGTIVGDPIEVAALGQAYRFSKDSKCYLGSVKSNLGHTDAAAGVSGFIKAMLAIHHGLIPPTVNYNSPNPSLKIEETPFSINQKTVPWPNTGFGVRRAAVNSLGLGGTNAHVILEEFNLRSVKPIQTDGKTLYFPISASGPRELTRALDEIGQFGLNHSGKLAGMATTLQLGRRVFAHRACLLASTAQELAQEVERVRQNSKRIATKAAKASKVCFLFPGQGGQYEGMGKTIREEGGIFAEVANQCLDIFDEIGVRLRPVLWPDTRDGLRGHEDGEIHRMLFAQAAMFTLEISLATHFKEVMKNDIHALLGHSLGAYVAACLAEVFTLRDACRIVKERATIFEKLGAGSMLAVLAPEHEVQNIIPETLSIAAINHPSQIVLSGPVLEIIRFSEKLGQLNIDSQRIHVSRAAHSWMLDQHLNGFEQFLRTVMFRPPKMHILSDFTGNWAGDVEINSPCYWASHLRHVVRFSDCVEKLLKERDLHIFEMGPGHTLTSLVASHPDYRNQFLYQTLPHAKENHDLRYDKKALASAWEAGMDLNWPTLTSASLKQGIPIPGYQFARNKFNILDSCPVRIETETVENQETTKPASDPCPYRSEMLAIFHELFGDTSIEGEDNFFDFGGHSLLALRMFRLIRTKFSVALPVQLIFRYQTPYTLADEVRRAAESEVHNV